MDVKVIVSLINVRFLFLFVFAVICFKYKLAKTRCKQKKMLQSRKKLLNECLFLAELKELLLDDIAKSTVKARNTVLNDYYNKICEKLAKPELSTYSKKDVLKVLNNWDYTANKRNI